jgi:hypothetical protein
VADLRQPAKINVAMSPAALLSTLQALNDECFQHVELSDVLHFIRLCAMATPFIRSWHHDLSCPLPALSFQVLAMLTEALDQPVHVLEGLWDVLKDTIWAHPEVVASDDKIRAFNANGLCHGLGEFR